MTDKLHSQHCLALVATSSGGSDRQCIYRESYKHQSCKVNIMSQGHYPQVLIVVITS